MSLWRMVWREIAHRKLNFALGMLAVSIAMASLAGAFTLLESYRLRTELFVAERRAEVEADAARMEDEVRKITKNLGFNVLILPRDQNLADVYASGFAEKTMPEEYAKRLANSKLITVNHLLPSLTRKLVWEEQKRTIVLVGTRGEVPILQRSEKKPILEAVPKGKIVLGYELHRQLGLKPGDAVRLQGREFKVHKNHPARGNQDDITVWIDLAEAQDLLEMPGRINAILALQCNCETVDRMAEIRAEISKILPDTQAVEFQSQAVARAEARKLATAKALQDVERERKLQEQTRRDREALAAWLVPLLILASAAWVGLLVFGNTRERVAEVGVLRALGWRSAQIVWLFMTKALAMGALGAGAGFVLGWALGAAWGEADLRAAFDPKLLGACLVLAPLLAAIASWLPAQRAAGQDPVAVLRED
ncbi:MAG: hypothetical protein AMXMBFR7_18850 [Planctomycetota bacterium]